MTHNAPDASMEGKDKYKLIGLINAYKEANYDVVEIGADRKVLAKALMEIMDFVNALLKEAEERGKYEAYNHIHHEILGKNIMKMDTSTISAMHDCVKVVLREISDYGQSLQSLTEPKG